MMDRRGLVDCFSGMSGSNKMPTLTLRVKYIEVQIVEIEQAVKWPLGLVGGYYHIVVHGGSEISSEPTEDNGRDPPGTTFDQLHLG